MWRGGLAYYGGFIFAVAFAYYYVRKHKLGWWRTADLAAPGIMLGLVCGRLGCFLNGCCYGKPTTSWLGVVFPQRPGVAVHPTQLYESAACFVCFAHPYYVVRPRRRAFGDVFAAMLILYGIARIICEIWRDDDRGVFFGFISTSQLISIPLIAGGLVLLWTSRSEARHSLGVASRPLRRPPLFARLRAAHLRRGHRRRPSSSPSSSARAPRRAPARIPTRCATSASGSWSRR